MGDRLLGVKLVRLAPGDVDNCIGLERGEALAARSLVVGLGESWSSVYARFGIVFGTLIRFMARRVN